MIHDLASTLQRYLPDLPSQPGRTGPPRPFISWNTRQNVVTDVTLETKRATHAKLRRWRACEAEHGAYERAKMAEQDARDAREKAEEERQSKELRRSLADL